MSQRNEITQQITLSLPKVRKPLRRLSIIHAKEYDEYCALTTLATVPLTTLVAVSDLFLVLFCFL